MLLGGKISDPKGYLFEQEYLGRDLPFCIRQNSKTIIVKYLVTYYFVLRTSALDTYLIFNSL